MSINFCHALFSRLFTCKNLVRQALIWLLKVWSHTSYTNLRTKFKEKTYLAFEKIWYLKSVCMIKKIHYNMLGEEKNGW